MQVLSPAQAATMFISAGEQWVVEPLPIIKLLGDGAINSTAPEINLFLAEPPEELRFGNSQT